MNFLLLSWFCMSLKQWQQACIRAEHLNSIPSAIRAISSRKVSLAVTRPAHFTLLEALRGKHPPLCITLSASPMLLPTAARETSVRNCLARCSNKGQPQKDVPRANCSATALDCRSASSVGTALMCAWDLFLTISRCFYSLLPRDNLLRLFQGYCKYLLLHIWNRRP